MNPTSCHSIVTLILLLILFPYSNVLAAWSGQVMGVADGDTISVLRGNEKVNIRLYGVDTPEKKQAFGNQAKKFTNAAVRKMSVKIVPFETDKYGRTVAMVYVGDQCLNENLIRDGFAWVYRKYCKEDFCRSWLNLEASAREKGRGLWVDPEPKPPWEWRKDSKKKNDWWGRVVR